MVRKMNRNALEGNGIIQMKEIENNIIYKSPKFFYIIFTFRNANVFFVAKLYQLLQHKLLHTYLWIVNRLTNNSAYFYLHKILKCIKYPNWITKTTLLNERQRLAVLIFFQIIVNFFWITLVALLSWCWYIFTIFAERVKCAYDKSVCQTLENLLIASKYLPLAGTYSKLTYIPNIQICLPSNHYHQCNPYTQLCVAYSELSAVVGKSMALPAESCCVHTYQHKYFHQPT